MKNIETWLSNNEGNLAERSAIFRKGDLDNDSAIKLLIAICTETSNYRGRGRVNKIVQTFVSISHILSTLG